MKPIESNQMRCAATAIGTAELLDWKSDKRLSARLFAGVMFALSGLVVAENLNIVGSDERCRIV